MDRVRQKQSTAFQIKMNQIVYQLFNSFGFNKEFESVFSQKESERANEKLKIKSLSERSKSDTEQSIQLKQIGLNEITKPLWIKLSRNDFASLIKDIVNNLDNKDYQTKINNVNYDFKSAEQFLLKIVTKKVSENEAHKMYKNLIKPKVDELASAKGRDKDKRDNILIILENIESSIFDGYYYHYFDNLKLKTTEKSIAERTKLRRQRLDIVKKREKTINCLII